jgi:hypothetical protein
MSHYPHRIRLRGPWECEPLARIVQGSTQTVDLPAKRRMTMPCRWRQGGLVNFAGRVRFRRHFGYPGRIDADERVWLLFEGFEGDTQIALNGAALGRHRGVDGPLEFDVTQLLNERNNLVLEIESEAESGGLWGDVALEIRRTAYLRGVSMCRGESPAGPELRVRGQVVGECAGLLELYVLLDNKTVAYTQTQADPAGHAFELAELLGPEQAAPGQHSVRIELVNVATVWYAVELTMDLEV